MRYLLLIISLIALLLISSSLNAEQYLRPSQTGYYVENKGQWNARAKFRAKTKSFDVWVTDNSLIYDLKKVKRIIDSDKNESMNSNMANEKKVIIERNPVKMSFVGARKGVFKLDESNRYKTYFNYLLGKDSTKWAVKIHPYRSVALSELYDGISLRYYFENGDLRYDIIVEPNADPSRIKMDFEGGETIGINPNGDLTINTKLGDISVGKIFAYQKVNSKTKEIPCNFNLSNKETVSFNIGEYDKKKELIIDPLVYSIGLCSYDIDRTEGIATDNKGNAYICGGTDAGEGFPITSQHFIDTVSSEGYSFLSKINYDGTELIFSTFIGSKDGQSCGIDGITLDKQKNIYFAGGAGKGFPVTENAYRKEILDSGRYAGDAMIFKLDSTGSKFIFSTYLNLPKNVIAEDIKTDNEGNVYIAGRINVKGLQTTENALKKEYSKDTSSKSDWADGYIFKLNSSGSDLLYCTYFGGLWNDGIHDFDVDGEGNVYIVGGTHSPDFPFTENAYKDTILFRWSKGPETPFIAKINSNSGELLYATAIGGLEQQGLLEYDRDKRGRAFDNILSTVPSGRSIDIDKHGCAYITGFASGYGSAIDYPVTPGAIHDVPSGSPLHIFVSKINEDGSELLKSAKFGGSLPDASDDIAVDKDGNVYLSGWTSSSDFPVTNDAYQSYLRGGDDIFVCKLNPDFSEILYSTYFGDTGDEAETKIAVDDNQCVYVTGSTGSWNFPLTNPDLPFRGGIDVWAAKFDLATSVEEEVEFSGNNLSIFPNPVFEKCVLNIKSPTNTKTEISVYNLNGVKIRSFSANLMKGENNIPLDLSDCFSGFYYIKVKTSSGVLRGSLVLY